MASTSPSTSSEDDHKAASIDLEKRDEVHHYVKEVSIQHLDDGVPRHRGVWAKLWACAAYLDRFGVEQRGIEPVPPEDRPHKRIWHIGLLWMSANLQPTSFALGALGPTVFELGLKDAALTILFFNLLTAIPAAMMSVFGAKLGLRQMVIGRYSFGPYAVLFPVLLNALACIGWSSVNSIVAGQILHVVSDDHQIPESIAILVIALITLGIALFGYKVVHIYERYAWIPVPIIAFIILGENVQYMDSTWGGSGTIEAASVLSFGAAIAGFALGWVSLAADYTIMMPADTPSWKLFGYTYAGLLVGMIPLQTLGAAMTTTFTARPDFAALYASDSTGGLLKAGLENVHGFGRFCLVLLALSIVANNIPNVYSFALTVQTLHPWIQAIPRFILSIVCTGAYVGIAIAGKSSFEETLDTLLVLLAYWLAIYFVIVIEEHVFFRRKLWSNYEPNDYNKPSKLPRGPAAAIAVCCGIAGAVVGMANQWYIGPLAGDIESMYGGDIGFELSFAFTAISYAPLRCYEKRYFGV